MKIDDESLSKLAARVGRQFVARGLCVATAESCTGGWIAKALTDIAGSSQWFGEGWVTYSNAAKRERLGVAGSLLERHGAVSEPVVRVMATAAMRLARADLAVAVSGIAGPGGAVAGKPVGTVWFCWARRQRGGVRLCTEMRQFRGDRDAVRRKSVAVALRGLLPP